MRPASRPQPAPCIGSCGAGQQRALAGGLRSLLLRQHGSAQLGRICAAGLELAAAGLGSDGRSSQSGMAGRRAAGSVARARWRQPAMGPRAPPARSHAAGRTPATRDPAPPHTCRGACRAQASSASSAPGRPPVWKGGMSEQLRLDLAGGKPLHALTQVPTAFLIGGQTLISYPAGVVRRPQQQQRQRQELRAAAPLAGRSGALCRPLMLPHRRCLPRAQA